METYRATLTLIDPATNASKFWTVERDGCEVCVTYGRIGTTGQTQVKGFGNVLAAEEHVGKMLLEKDRKGYRVRSGRACPRRRRGTARQEFG